MQLHVIIENQKKKKGTNAKYVAKRGEITNKELWNNMKKQT